MIVLAETDPDPAPEDRIPGVLYVRLTGTTPDPDPGPTAPTITTHPQPVTMGEGSPASWTSAASGDPAPTVQWQLLDASTWLDIAGATNPTYTLATTTPADDGLQVRAAWTNTGGTTYSNPALLTVTTEPDPEPGLTWSDDFERPDGEIGNGWIQQVGTGAVLQGGALVLAGSGFQRVAHPGHVSPLRFEATYTGQVTSYTGIFIGRSVTDPVTYPGLCLINTNAAAYRLQDAESASSPSLANIGTTLADLANASPTGGTLGLEYTGTEVNVLWNGAVVNTVTDAGALAVIAPDGAVGISGNGAEPWTSVGVAEL